MIFNCKSLNVHNLIMHPGTELLLAVIKILTKKNLHTKVAHPNGRV